MSHRAKAVLDTSMPDRWMAEISYLDGKQHVIAFEDLDEIVEMGPDWNTIEKIVITLNRPCPPSKIVEELLRK